MKVSLSLIRIYRIYWKDLQAAVQLIQQSLAEHKVQESSSFSVPRGWVSQLIICICWDPREVGSNASEGTDVLARPRRRRRRNEPFLLPFSLHRLPEKGVAQIKGVSSRLKIQIKGMLSSNLKI